MYCNVCNKYRKSKTLKYHILKKLDLSIVYSKCCHVYKKIFKEEKLIEILEILGLSANI